MSSVRQHIDKAKYNEQFFEDVKHDYPDWAITGLFYSAIHLVDAFLSRKSIAAGSHEMRFSYIRQLKELKIIYEDYRSLYDYSINARYKMFTFNTDGINDAHLKFYVPIKYN